MIPFYNILFEKTWLGNCCLPNLCIDSYVQIYIIVENITKNHGQTISS